MAGETNAKRVLPCSTPPPLLRASSSSTSSSSTARAVLLFGLPLVLVLLAGVQWTEGAEGVSCPRKCTCRNISENIHSLRVRCDEQQLATWRELDFGEDVHGIVSM